jgi:hypothetical protein
VTEWHVMEERGQGGTGIREAHGPGGIEETEAYVWATERREGERAETLEGHGTNQEGIIKKRMMRCFSEERWLLSVTVEARNYDLSQN